MNWYDMNLRMYDPALARWMVQDPVIHYTKSTYNAFDNNPVYFADPSGADAEGGETPDPKLAFGVPLSSVMRTSSVETTIQGKSTNNTIINFLHKEEVGDFDKADLKKNGWEVIDVNNTDEANAATKGKSFNNLMVLAHGGTLTIDKEPTGQYGIFLSSDKNDESMTNWVWDSDITAYQLKTLTNNVTKNNIENLVSMGKTVNNGKNYIFMTCNMAWGGNTIADFLSTSIGNNVDVFMNRDIGYMSTSNKKVTASSALNTNFTTPKRYNSGWIQSNSGITKEIKNIQINQNGVKVVK